MQSDTSWIFFSQYVCASSTNFAIFEGGLSLMIELFSVDWASMIISKLV